MDNILTRPTAKTDAENEAEFEEVLAGIRQCEITFDTLQAEIVALREEGARKSARSDATLAAIDQQLAEMRSWRPGHAQTVS